MKKVKNCITHGRVHEGFSSFLRFAACKKGRCKQAGNRFVIPHEILITNVVRNYQKKTIIGTGK